MLQLATFHEIGWFWILSVAERALKQGIMKTPGSSKLYILSFEVWPIFARALHSYTSGFYANHAHHGYSSRNTTHTVLQKLKAWPQNIKAQQNTVGHKQKVSMRPIFTWRSERSLTVSKLNQGWFSQKLGPEIKSTYQGLMRTVQPKKWYDHICAYDA